MPTRKKSSSKKGSSKSKGLFSKPKPKATGLSLHIGLNFVDAAHYGSENRLAGCEPDAKDMIALAKKRGFKPTMLLNEQATAEAVTGAISSAANKLKTGDMFFITYSGHGSQVPDKNGDEKDGMDETWVLFNRQLVDDELYSLWAQFAPGVRILVLSDSCHSGSVTRKIMFDQLNNGPLAQDLNTPPAPRTRALTDDVRERTYKNNRALYDGIQGAFRAGDKVAVNASILLISGCQDNQLSGDGDRNGLFTQTMLQVYNNGKFEGRYRKFWEAIAQKMPPWQSPNFYRAGVTDPTFEAQNPFTI